MPKKELPKVFSGFWCMGETVDRWSATWRPVIGRFTRRGPRESAGWRMDQAGDKWRSRIGRCMLRGPRNPTRVHRPGVGDTWQPLVGGLTWRGPRDALLVRWTEGSHVATPEWRVRMRAIHAAPGAGVRQSDGADKWVADRTEGATHRTDHLEPRGGTRLGLHRCPVFGTCVKPMTIRPLHVGRPSAVSGARKWAERPKLGTWQEFSQLLGWAYE